MVRFGTTTCVQGRAGSLGVTTVRGNRMKIVWGLPTAMRRSDGQELFTIYSSWYDDCPTRKFNSLSSQSVPRQRLSLGFVLLCSFSRKYVVREQTA